MHYIVGLLVGDYLLQNDWQANNKTWSNRRWVGLPIALFHAAIVTACIFLCAYWEHGSWSVWAWWKLGIIWLSHGLQDWMRATVWWMTWFKQFNYFKAHMPQAYIWGLIVVDNVAHILLLFILYYV